MSPLVVATEVFRIIAKRFFDSLLNTPFHQTMEKTRASINGKKGIFGCGGASFGVVEEQEFLDEISQVIDQFTEASLLALVHVDKFLSNFEGVPPP